VHEDQILRAGRIPMTTHDVRLHLIVTPERVLRCRPRGGEEHRPGIVWSELSEEKIAAIPLLQQLRSW
jgi:5-formyltetrahydrofolate cyclo-ligase